MNNKELLEKIKKQFNQGRMTIGSGACFVSDEQVEWLIQQAERVEELQLEVNDWRAEVQKWQQFYKESEESHLETKELLHSTISEINRYKQALEFYADEETYETKFATDTDEICDPFTLIELDEGKKARQALEGAK